MKMILTLPILIFLFGCVSQPVSEEKQTNLIVGNFILPVEDIPKIEQLGPVTSLQLEKILNSYSDSNSSVHRLTNQIEGQTEAYWMCGGILVDPDSQRLYESGSKFEVVGVSEKWIPIEGKTTKVLHLKLAK